jgi:hypothetical protein
MINLFRWMWPRSGPVHVDGAVGFADNGAGTATATRFAEVHGFHEAVATLRSAVCEIAGAHGMMLAARDGNEIVCVAQDPLSPVHTGDRFPFRLCLSGRTMLSGEPTIIPDVVLDKTVPLNAYFGTYMRTMAVIPLGPQLDGDARQMTMTIFWITVVPVDAATLDQLIALGEDAGRAFARLPFDLPPARMVA